MKLVSKNSTKQPKNAIINLCFGVKSHINGVLST